MPRAANPSAGTYAFENDNSAYAQPATTSIGVVVGASKKGPVGKRIAITDIPSFVATYGKNDPSLSYMHYAAKAFLSQGSLLYVTRVANNALYGGIRVATVTNFSQVQPIGAGLAEPEDYVFSADDILFISGYNQGNWNNNIRVLLYPDTNDIDEEAFFLQVFEGASTVPVESHRCTLRYKNDGFGGQLFVEDVINENSTYIKVRLNAAHPAFATDPNAVLINAITEGYLTQGDDGDPITDGDMIDAWQLYEDPEEISVNILIQSGYPSVAVQLEMDRIAEARDDCMAILDVPALEQGAQDAVSFRRNTLALSSSYSAVYSPDLLIQDTDNGRNIYVPPSGHVAAAFALTDNNAELWFAPAGLQRGVLPVFGVRHVYKLGHRNMFVDNQINAIQFMAGQGIAIWGADTLQSFASSLSDIPVRRLVSYLKTELKKATLPSVFDPNDDFLLGELRRIAERFMKPIKQGRGVYRYEVVCDERNNNRQTRAAGDVILDVYIDPTRYTKRIHLNAIATDVGGIEFALNLIDQN